MQKTLDNKIICEKCNGLGYYRILICQYESITEKYSKCKGNGVY